MIRHRERCFCCTGNPGAGLGRRGLLGMAMASAMFIPGSGRAGGGKYEAMLLACIDPRFPAHTIDYMRQRNLVGKYSQLNLAGAAIAAVAPAFDAWRPAIWGNLSATIALHQIETVIALDHRECGAAAIAYGKDAVSTADGETATHRRAMAEFRDQVKSRHPHLKIETGLMALDGSVQVFTA